MSSTRTGILAGGNWIVDAVKMIDVWPQQDALANIASTTQGTGGSPFNILVDLALMGADFPLLAAGLVGVPFAPFLATCLGGRLLRFGVLVTAPQLLRPLFG